MLTAKIENHFESYRKEKEQFIQRLQADLQKSIAENVTLKATITTLTELLTKLQQSVDKLSKKLELLEGDNVKLLQEVLAPKCDKILADTAKQKESKQLEFDLPEAKADRERVANAMAELKASGTEVKAHIRRKKAPKEIELSSGVRISQNVPVVVERILPDEVKDLPEELYEIINVEERMVLARQASTCVAIKYEKVVARIKTEAEYLDDVKKAEKIAQQETISPVTPAQERSDVADGQATQAIFIQQVTESQSVILPSSEYLCVLQAVGGKIFRAKIPGLLKDKSAYDVSFVAKTIIDKLINYLPLYRQNKEFMRNGVYLSESVLTALFLDAAKFLEPIYCALKSSILSSGILLADETWMRVGFPKEPGKKMPHGYYWIFYGDKDEAMAVYCPSRSTTELRSILGDFCGKLVTDDYQSYTEYVTERNKTEPNIQHGLCWAHTTRYFQEARGSDPDFVDVIRKEISDLYDIEAEARENNFSPPQLLKARQERVTPIVDKIFSLLKSAKSGRIYLPKSPVSKAINYALDNEKELRLFLNHADVPPDTNAIERLLRPIPMGRKNYMFCTTVHGAEALAILQSLIFSCNTANINAYDYLVDVLQRIDRHPSSQVADLIPRRWKEKFSATPLRSPLFMATHK